jgi:hypothetical protein
MAIIGRIPGIGDHKPNAGFEFHIFARRTPGLVAARFLKSTESNDGRFDGVAGFPA